MTRVSDERKPTITIFSTKSQQIRINEEFNEFFKVKN